MVKSWLNNCAIIWNDVLGVLKIQKQLLDTTYLLYWAQQLQMTRLLQQAFDNAGLEI